MDKKYNGYSNYETWNVALWLNNDEGLYNLTKNMPAHSLETFVTDVFIDTKKFGDLDTVKEIARVDWNEVEEACKEE